MLHYLENVRRKLFHAAWIYFRSFIRTIKVQVKPMGQFYLETYSDQICALLLWYIDYKPTETITKYNIYRQKVHSVNNNKN